MDNGIKNDVCLLWTRSYIVPCVIEELIVRIKVASQKYKKYLGEAIGRVDIFSS